MRQWWLGRAIPCAGIASVKVAPEYRGGGIGRRLMTALLDAVAERGYPLSALYPATMPIYRSLGWELAGGMYVATVPARSLRTLMAPDAARRPPRTAPVPEIRRAARPTPPRSSPGSAAPTRPPATQARLPGTKARPGSGWATRTCTPT